MGTAQTPDDRKKMSRSPSTASPGKNHENGCCALKPCRRRAIELLLLEQQQLNDESMIIINRDDDDLLENSINLDLRVKSEMQPP